MLIPDASGWYSSLYADDGFGNLLPLSVDSSMTRNMFRWDTWYRINPLLNIKYRDNYRL